MISTKKKRNITINTDASFKNECGGFAFWIVCNEFKIQRSGYFRNKVLTPHDAETMAIGNAIFMLANMRILPKFDSIIINTDSMISIKRYKYSTNLKINGFDIKKSVNKLLQRTGAKKLDMRHVKAHNGTPDARSWVNDWCDKESRKWRIIRENLNK